MDKLRSLILQCYSTYRTNKQLNSFRHSHHSSVSESDVKDRGSFLRLADGGRISDAEVDLSAGLRRESESEAAEITETR